MPCAGMNTPVNHKDTASVAAKIATGATTRPRAGASMAGCAPRAWRRSIRSTKAVSSKAAALSTMPPLRKNAVPNEATASSTQSQAVYGTSTSGRDGTAPSAGDATSSAFIASTASTAAAAPVPPRDSASPGVPLSPRAPVARRARTRGTSSLAVCTAISSKKSAKSTSLVSSTA